MIKFTRLTHNKEVGKIYSLDDKKNLASITVGNIEAAQVQTVAINTIYELPIILESLDTNSHIMSGVDNTNAKLCIKGPVSEGVINRTNKYFPFPNSGDGSLLCIDADGIDSFPEFDVFKDYAHVQYTSSGSCITDLNGTIHKGFEGSHTFYAVKDGKDIPRTMRILHQREILNNRAVCKVSAAGTFLERSCVDVMLASPSQPIYYKPTLLDGLQQKKQIQVVEGDTSLIDTKKLVPNLTKDEKALYEFSLEAYKVKLAPEMESVRKEWVSKRVQEGTPSDQAERALKTRDLEGSFVIHTKIGTFTVAEILKDPMRFNEVTCKDPIEPDYGSDTVAKIFSYQARPMINSNAHGGTTFSLYDASAYGFGNGTLDVILPDSSVNITQPVTIDQTGDIQQPLPNNALYPMETAISTLSWNPGQVKNNGQNVISTFDNFKLMLGYYGITVGYDVIAKDVLMQGQNMSHTGDLKDTANLARVKHCCELNGFKTSTIPDYLTIMMNDNQINPVALWIQSKKWDGVDRINELFNTLVLDDDQNPDVAYMMFRKWLIGACRIAQGRINTFEYVLCIQEHLGGSGKTRWFNKLCPDAWTIDGVIFDPSDKDSVKLVISRWLVELGELDSTFRKDIKKTMAFLGKHEDEIRLPYGAKSSKFQRRTAFFGSVNKKSFLVDDSGDRRFWPISVTSINYQHNIDMQQLWAQVDDIPDTETHWLNPAENDMVIQSNELFKEIDPIHDMLGDYFGNNEVMVKDVDMLGNVIGEHPAPYVLMNCTEILINAGIDRPTKRDAATAAAWLKKEGYRPGRTNSKRGFYVKVIYDNKFFG